MPAVLRLPPETLQLILEHGTESSLVANRWEATHREARNYLCSTSLVCSQWREESQALLWKIVWVRWNSEARKMMASPAYGHYVTAGVGMMGGIGGNLDPDTTLELLSGLHGVRELTFVNFSNDWADYSDELEDMDWRLSLEIFSLESLQGVTSIILEQSSFQEETVLTNCISVPLQRLDLQSFKSKTSSIYTFFASPSLTHLALTGRVPLSFIPNFLDLLSSTASQLVHLELVYLPLSRIPPLVATCTRLSSLTITTDGRLGALIISSLSARLRSLKLIVKDLQTTPESEGIRQALRAVLEKMETPALTSLRVLDFRLTFGGHQKRFLEDMPEWEPLKARVRDIGCQLHY